MYRFILFLCFASLLQARSEELKSYPSFDVTLPKGWVSPRSFIFIKGEPSAGIVAHIQFFKLENLKQSLKDYVTEQSQKISESFNYQGSFKLIESKSLKHPDYSIYKVVFLGQRKGDPFVTKQMQYFIRKGSEMYILTLGSSAPLYEKYFSEFAQIVQDFKPKWGFSKN